MSLSSLHICWWPLFSFGWRFWGFVKISYGIIYYSVEDTDWMIFSWLQMLCLYFKGLCVCATVAGDYIVQMKVMNGKVCFYLALPFSTIHYFFKPFRCRTYTWCE